MIASTYVTHGERAWNVSTIDRKSSAIEGPDAYAETLVWEWCPETRQRIGDFVYQGEGCRGSISNHITIVRRIRDAGAFWESDGGES